MSQTDTKNDGSHAYLKFDHPNVGYVIDGMEDATIRVGLERGFEPGQHIQLRTLKNNVFGHAEIEDVFEGRLATAWFDMTVTDSRSHPTNSDLDLVEALNEHYPDQEVQLDSEVTVIYFDLKQIGTQRAQR